ncbi:dihydroxyacetone kinase phosphoryl donor subunit DhaM [Oceanivirga salmonicida]|uniref:dihydroxyacetone kinase phosphoryl donor subunit DhaM n=1 Tax=Oceanivirga salmonicida TaxID=1769291 RepID=UPI000829945F|nr:dihydroxyacetone kinase phosphoryl donor subunit DhaM [Oceanivirga salmonicida]
MIGMVVVSHNKYLAEETIKLASIMKSGEFNIVNAGGMVDSEEYGTDPIKIMECINQANSGDGVIVFCELGSSLMNTQMAVEMLNDDKVKIADAPLVEGLVVGVSSNSEDSTLEELLNEIEEVKNLKKSL